MDRGHLGTAVAPTERDDDSYLDFVEGLRVFNMSKVQAAMAERVAAEPGAIDQLPIVASRNRLYRSQQEMMWRGVIETYCKRQDELLRELDEAERRGPGRVEWDPAFVYPDYYAQVNYHLQPGGYATDPLAGYIYTPRDQGLLHRSQ